MQSLINHAEVAAAAHHVAAKVTEFDDVDGDGRSTGRKGVSVVIFQDVYFDPEDDPRRPADIENRRLIGISRGDAKRLYRSRRGRAGGQSYIDVRTARRALSALGETTEEAVLALMARVRSGALRTLAFQVANDAAAIEVEMRDQLCLDLARLTDRA